MLYRKKPIAVEASQWFTMGDHPAVVPVPYDHPVDRQAIRPGEWGWIDDLEGGHLVQPGDWIITGVRGEHYACKSDIFAETYEPVGAGDAAQPLDHSGAHHQGTVVRRAGAPPAEEPR